MSFKLPSKPSSSVCGNDARYKHEVGGHVGRGTVTRGDSRAHPNSAVDPNVPYPEPAEVSRYGTSNVCSWTNTRILDFP